MNSFIGCLPYSLLTSRTSQSLQSTIKRPFPIWSAHKIIRSSAVLKSRRFLWLPQRVCQMSAMSVTALPPGIVSQDQPLTSVVRNA
ncbi:hypothetical protein REMIM1_PF00026 (plasmid) [Rhizobium etli bv. mimosae str. Mim1]|nr:hypothetical protein REMIM1_PF00026 [Rhizobium etli bv. mimosae str. Mim1]